MVVSALGVQEGAGRWQPHWSRGHGPEQLSSGGRRGPGSLPGGDAHRLLPGARAAAPRHGRASFNPCRAPRAPLHPAAARLGRGADTWGWKLTSFGPRSSGFLGGWGRGLRT